VKRAPFEAVAGGQKPLVAAQVASKLFRIEAMTNMLDLLMLFCACVAAMAFGILTAYMILRTCFALMRPQRRTVPVEAQPEAVRIS
jgi:hypothetical protein